MRFDDWNNDELYHHGIKGQTWGVRRYQNPDGSLTPAGQLRYLKYEAKLERRKIKEDSRIQRAKIKADRKINAAKSKEKIKNLSDEDLKARISRLSMEKEYKELKQDVSGITHGREVVKDLLTRIDTIQINKLKEKELDTRVKEAESKAKQARQNARQAKEQRKQASFNLERDKTNKSANKIRAKNDRIKLKMAEKMIGKMKKLDSNKYKDYVAGKITIDELLGLQNKKD